jgi:hypothetical protein
MIVLIKAIVDNTANHMYLKLTTLSSKKRSLELHILPNNEHFGHVVERFQVGLINLEQHQRCKHAIRQLFAKSTFEQHERSHITTHAGNHVIINKKFVITAVPEKILKTDLLIGHHVITTQKIGITASLVELD